jgi:hypothetical protein
LSPLANPGLVPDTVVAAVGIELGGREIFGPQSVAQALADRQMLRSGDITVRSSASVSLGRLVIVIASVLFRVDRAATDRRVRFEPFRIGLFL